MQPIYHKKNELFEVEFYQDKECTEVFNFTNAKNLYIELKDGDITPILSLDNLLQYYKDTHNEYYNVKLYTNYIATNIPNIAFKRLHKFQTLNDITPNLSKYIPEDNAIRKYFEKYTNSFTSQTLKYKETLKYPEKLTIFLSNGTQSELLQAIEEAKELKEKYGVEEVNLFVLHWLFRKLWIEKGGFGDVKIFYDPPYSSIRRYFKYVNKIITTNSTGILPVQDTERLQVIDCKEIFEEYLKEKNKNLQI